MRLIWLEERRRADSCHPVCAASFWRGSYPESLNWRSRWHLAFPRNHAWCRELSLADCDSHGGVCRVEWSLWKFQAECVPAKPSAFLSLCRQQPARENFGRKTLLKPTYSQQRTFLSAKEVGMNFRNLWGTMLLQFVFSVYVDLGMTTKSPG